MKAIRFHSRGGPEVLRLDDISVPISQPGEALFRLRAAGANYADIYQFTGVSLVTIQPSIQRSFP